MSKLQNKLIVERSKTFQLLPDYSLLKVGEVGNLLVYLPENDFFVGVSNQMEAGFERRLRNVVKNSVNYISVKDWKTQRATPKEQQC